LPGKICSTFRQEQNNSVVSASYTTPYWTTGMMLGARFPTCVPTGQQHYEQKQL
jgi:hypothetical protein